MAALQALRAFAPGRASHRLTVRRRSDRFWIEPPDFTDGQSVEMQVRGPYEGLLEMGESRSSQAAAPVRCLKPSTINLSEVPTEVRSSSNAQLEWSSELRPGSHPENIKLGENVPGSDLVTSLDVYTHGRRSPVEVRRWAESALVQVVREGGSESRGRVHFKDDGDSVGIAVGVHADAIAINLPASLDGALSKIPDSLLRGLRLERFKSLVEDAQDLELPTTGFARVAAADAYLAALARVSGSSAGAADAHERIESDGLLASIQRARAGEIDPNAIGELEPGDESILEVIRRSAPVLWEEPSGAWADWLREKTGATIGAAVHSALWSLCPEFDFDDVSLDLGTRSGDGMTTTTIWLTESMPGGGGALQEAARRIAERPRVFGELILDSLTMSDSELVDQEAGQGRPVSAGRSGDRRGHRRGEVCPDSRRKGEELRQPS